MSLSLFLFACGGIVAFGFELWRPQNFGFVDFNFLPGTLGLLRLACGTAFASVRISISVASP